MSENEREKCGYSDIPESVKGTNSAKIEFFQHTKKSIYLAHFSFCLKAKRVC